MGMAEFGQLTLYEQMFTLCLNLFITLFRLSKKVFGYTGARAYMGEIRAKVTLQNDRDIFRYQERIIKEPEIRCVTLDALVDTGAVMVLLPQDVVEFLGLEITEKVIVTLANEQKIELEVAGTLSLRIENRMMKTDCLVGPPQCEPLIGQLVLERLDLVLDPLMRTIHHRPESPFLPSLKLKTTTTRTPR
jgi:clan AA aspartic protease